MDKVECGNCNHIFESKNSRCEDWRDPKKKFMCPSCKKGLISPTTKELLKNKQFIMKVGALPFFIPIGGSVFNRLFSDSTSIVNIVLVLAFIGLLFLFYTYLKRRIKPIKLRFYK